MSQGRSDRPGERLAPKAVIGRVSLYLRRLESLQRRGEVTTSSSQLGLPLGIHDAQVRKDLAFFGQFGCPGIGYRIDDLISTLRRILGIDREWCIALVGLGNLGQALLKYKGFRGRGFRILALYDNDPDKIGKTFDDMVVRPIADLPHSAPGLEIEMAAVCVPADSAQEVVELVVAAGIPGILNFAPQTLIVPNQLSVVNVDLSIQLEHLAYQVHNQQVAGSITPQTAPFRSRRGSLES